MGSNPVPQIRQVIPGALVNIVLKADQRTGREVRGTVAHVLTRGDHHRGIKVRLVDGRVGRVQSMASSADGGSSIRSSTGSTLTDNPNLLSPVAPASENPGGHGAQGPRPRYRDARLEEPLDVAPEQINLGAYIVPSRRRGGNKKSSNANQADEASRAENSSSSNHYQPDVTSAVATCPVCGAFEGDETAVAHHVAEHFE
ncbi:hypothetical protein F5B22DRAFT_384385 [Xylaria bambusicola]|uniref:uncharacterized protein n=1 Tax=Xylaria bambusicola TaxID=326684 RepID=UPI002008E7BE|nr:uncharacterized protein F5B22DRAFT_384385 [Xylaria bambusicola]KAI0508787.1 hypothetical protein F5B22DRAFT_384385 [Xylaria bambusicola]